MVTSHSFALYDEGERKLWHRPQVSSQSWLPVLLCVSSEVAVGFRCASDTSADGDSCALPEEQAEGSTAATTERNNAGRGRGRTVFIPASLRNRWRLEEGPTGCSFFLPSSDLSCADSRRRPSGQCSDRASN